MSVKSAGIKIVQCSLCAQSENFVPQSHPLFDFRRSLVHSCIPTLYLEGPWVVCYGLSIFVMQQDLEGFISIR